MEKYNAVVNKFVEGDAKMEELTKKYHEDMDGACKAMLGSIEEEVKEWTSEDMDHFVAVAEHDDRVGDRCLAAVMGAYSKTHRHSKSGMKSVLGLAIILGDILAD